jgi:hypothetical protein
LLLPSAIPAVAGLVSVIAMTAVAGGNLEVEERPGKKKQFQREFN